MSLPYEGDLQSWLGDSESGRRAEWTVFLLLGWYDDGLVVVLVSLYEEEEVMMMTAQDRVTLRRGSYR